MEVITKELIFLDTETTGVDLKDRLVQVAYKIRGKKLIDGLFKPELPISIESMAICHITNKMVKDKPKFQGSDIHSDLVDLFIDKNTVLIAHNAKFDIDILLKEEINVKNYICTYKMAHHLDSEGVIPKYNLQYLRYLLELDVEGVAHDAMGDVLVLEKLFERLFEKMFAETDIEIPFATGDDAIKEMINISNKPLLFKKFNFGKYNGKFIKDIVEQDRGYLEWLLREKKKEKDWDLDWVYTLEKYL